MADEDPYPEHAKLKAVQKQSQACGEFLDWLRQEKKYLLGRNHDHTDDCYTHVEGIWHSVRICETSTGDLERVGHISTEELLAEFFGIDRQKLEKEKEALLEEQRALNRRIDDQKRNA